MNFKTYMVPFIVVNFVVINSFIDPKLALTFFKAKHLSRNLVVTCLNQTGKYDLEKSV